MKVWAAVTADPKSDEPGYLAYVSLYAERQSALEALRNSAAEDAETIEGNIKWHDEDTWGRRFPRIIKVTVETKTITPSRKRSRGEEART